MKRTLSATAIVCATISGSVAAQGAEPIKMTLVGASPAGMWSTLGAAVHTAIAAGTPGSVITYQTSSGGLANAALVSQGRAQLGIIGDMELNAAVKGSGPFNGKAFNNLRTLIRLYDPGSRFQTFHALADTAFVEKHGIKSIADLVSKRVPVRIAVNRPGNMESEIALDLLRSVGLDEKVIEQNGGILLRQTLNEMSDLLKDRKVDLVIAGYSFNHSLIQDMTRTFKPYLLDIPASAARDVAAKHAGEVCEIKPGEYSWNDLQITTVCVGAVVIANEALDSKAAYDLARGVIENIEKFKGGHRLLARSTPEMMAKPSAAAFHPGALKYYAEAGLAR